MYTVYRAVADLRGVNVRACDPCSGPRPSRKAPRKLFKFLEGPNIIIKWSLMVGISDGVRFLACEKYKMYVKIICHT